MVNKLSNEKSKSHGGIFQFFRSILNNLNEIAISFKSDIAKDAANNFSRLINEYDNKGMMSDVYDQLNEYLGVDAYQPMRKVTISVSGLSSVLSQYAEDDEVRQYKTIIGVMLSTRDAIEYVASLLEDDLHPNKRLDGLQHEYLHIYIQSCAKITLCKFGLGLLNVTSPLYVAAKNVLLTLYSITKLMASAVYASLQACRSVMASNHMNSQLQQGNKDAVLASSKADMAKDDAMDVLKASFEEVKGIFLLVSKSEKHSSEYLAVDMSLGAESAMNGYDQESIDMADSVLESSLPGADMVESYGGRMMDKAQRVYGHDYSAELVQDFTSAVDKLSEGAGIVHQSVLSLFNPRFSERSSIDDEVLCRGSSVSSADGDGDSVYGFDVQHSESDEESMSGDELDGSMQL